MKIFKALYSPMQRQRRGQVNLTSIVPTVESTRVPHAPYAPGSSNTSTTQGIKPSVIPYAVNQPADLQLWDSSFCPISLLGMNEFLDGDAKNITCSLLRMVTFIRQRKLEDKTVEDILQITKFGSVAWEFLSVIYEAGWDKLTTITTNLSGSVFLHNLTRLPQAMLCQKNCLRENKWISQGSHLLSHPG